MSACATGLVIATIAACSSAIRDPLATPSVGPSTMDSSLESTPIASQSSTASAGFQDDCIEFPSEQINAIAWSPDGTALGIASERTVDGVTTIRAMAWPSREVTEVQRGGDIDQDNVAMGEGNAVYWVRMIGESAEIERGARNGQVATFAKLPSPAVSGLRINRDAALWKTVDQRRGSVLLTDGRGAHVVYSTDAIIDSFGVSPATDRLAVITFDGPGTASHLVVVERGNVTPVPLQVRDAARVSLSGRGHEALLVDTMTADLISVPLEGGIGRTLAHEAIAGELSSMNVLAWMPAPSTTLDTGVCFSQLADP